MNQFFDGTLGHNIAKALAIAFSSPPPAEPERAGSMLAASTPGVGGNVVLAACDCVGYRIGHLVVASDGSLVAFVRNWRKQDGAISNEQSFDVARGIAADPDSIVGANCPVVDLRHYGRADSPMPMPGFIYGLRCERLTEDGEYFPDAAEFTPRPFCRFMAAAMTNPEINRRAFIESARGAGNGAKGRRNRRKEKSGVSQKLPTANVGSTNGRKSQRAIAA